MIPKTKRLRLIMPAVALLAAGLMTCEGGVSTGSGDRPSGSARQVTGTITALASPALGKGGIYGISPESEARLAIFVNGTRYEVTKDTKIVLDDPYETDRDLAVGQVVTVEGPSANGSGIASSIRFDDLLEGPVDGISIANGPSSTALSLMGRKVLVDDDTIFASRLPGVAALDQVKVGQVAEVSGYVMHDGTILATRFELKRDAYRPGEWLEAKGRVEGLDLRAMQFRLGGLQVDYRSAQIRGGSGLHDGEYVEVRSVARPLSKGGAQRLSAQEIDIVGGDLFSLTGSGIEGEIEGVITSVRGLQDANHPQIEVGGRQVTLASARFKNGDLLALQVGERVIVEGTCQSGLLLGEVVTLRRQEVARLETDVEAVDPIRGTVRVMGKTVLVNNLTLMNDARVLESNESSSSRRFFTLADLKSGERVTINVSVHPKSGSLVATHLERRDPARGDRLTGVISAIDGRRIAEVFGVAVVGDTERGSTIGSGDRVAVDGHYDNGVFHALHLARAL